MKLALKLIALSTILLAVGINAKGQTYLKQRSKTFLIKSANIIKESHKFLGDMEKQQLDGTFDQAVMHQRYARKLFLDGEFLNAMHHSDYARRLAFNVYHVKNDVKPKHWEYGASEKSAMKNLPMNNELDRRLMDAYPKLVFDDLPYLTDDKLYDLEFNDPKY
ncbi:hypothetical protein [Luteibaculum oceani]|uniref:Uncharacterized protein n=1 Tax=Luteibaculum oceani TaxID=1294296 RepID=A0A5C6V9G0_9FLAO|nr:hypothetical protein [Luteibaculum oceani]TXC82122.1 hypothetical protein FRX97_03240 [Luteibaculum oceani]